MPADVPAMAGSADMTGAATDTAGISEEEGGAACPDDAACVEESPSKDGSTCGKDAVGDLAADASCGFAFAARAETADVSVSNTAAGAGAVTTAGTAGRDAGADGAAEACGVGKTAAGAVGTGAVSAAGWIGGAGESTAAEETGASADIVGLGARDAAVGCVLAGAGCVCTVSAASARLPEAAPDGASWAASRSSGASRAGSMRSGSACTSTACPPVINPAMPNKKHCASGLCRTVGFICPSSSITPSTTINYGYLACHTPPPGKAGTGETPCGERCFRPQRRTA